MVAPKKGAKKKLNDGVGKDEATPQTEAGLDVDALLKNAPKSKIPTGIKPMLATLVDKPFDDEDWFFEVKWDGYRALAFINKGSHLTLPEQ